MKPARKLGICLAIFAIVELLGIVVVCVDAPSMIARERSEAAKDEEAQTALDRVLGGGGAFDADELSNLARFRSRDPYPLLSVTEFVLGIACFLLELACFPVLWRPKAAFAFAGLAALAWAALLLLRRFALDAGPAWAIHPFPARFFLLVSLAFPLVNLVARKAFVAIVRRAPHLEAPSIWGFFAQPANALYAFILLFVSAIFAALPAFLLG